MTPDLHVACERAVHVVTVDGKVLRAGRACLFILQRVGWGWIARLLALPPFVWLVEIAYRIVADHRPFFAKFLFTHEHDSTPDRSAGASC
jgi:predicted DCC family thiol-disulfide oxidoreductase YuxK